MQQSIRQIYVGGTQRSGSTVCGYLLGSHPEVWATRPRELRFLTDPGGLLDLVFGTRSRIEHAGAFDFQSRIARLRELGRYAVLPPTPDGFLRNLHGKWWMRLSPDGEPRGLHRGIDPGHMDRVTTTFAREYRDQPHTAARQLADALLRPATISADANTWVDTTPQNAENAHRLVRLNPDARVIFMIRDGRDTCASIIRRSWGPTALPEALSWWRNQALRAHVSVQRAGPKHAKSVLLEDLVLHARQPTLHALLEFLDLDITNEVQTFFDERMTPQRANIHRWKDEINARDRGKFLDKYVSVHAELTSLGLRLPPVD